MGITQTDGISVSLMVMEDSGPGVPAGTARRTELRNRLKKRGKRLKMQTPELTFRIEMFGNMIEELNYWHHVCEHEEGETEFEYAEQMFTDTLNAVRELREDLLVELSDYKQYCKNNEIPVDLSYFRIEKQLKESTFALLPNG